ncbi:MAG: MBL fold metallo-hydrolase [Oscillospiraceae bacterium]|jgi:L-ascorbate metabolism protein UlaG (beta-lactamase superfamily)|nr:MBL fold metallo-hydrolase [Oscillospiraceae bacterium]
MKKKFMVRWIGQGGYALRCGETVMLLDPYFSDIVEHVEGPRRLIPPPFAPENANPDYFLATHDHMDHLDTDMIARMDCAGVRFLCPESCKKTLLCLGKGISEDQITVTRRGETFSFADFTLEAHYADHTPDSVGFVVICDGIRAYFTGDTLYGGKVGASADADVIFCCINGRLGNMDAAEAALVAERSGAKLAIPNHYGMFAENTADPMDFVRFAEAAGRSAYVMQHNEEIDAAALLAEYRKKEIKLC